MQREKNMVWEHSELIAGYFVLLAVFTFLVFSFKTTYKWGSNQAMLCDDQSQNGIWIIIW